MEDKKQKTIFIIRAIAWFVFAAVLPFIFIAWRYQIFTKETKISITGLGIIAIIIFLAALIKLARYIYKGMESGMLKQCIHGFITTVMPLVMLYAIIEGIYSNLATFKLVLGFTTICEMIAIPIDPFPEWLKTKENGKFETLTDIAINKFFERKENEGK